MGFGYEHAKRLLDRYVEMLKQVFGEKLVSVALFGSVARGEAEAGSDIDLLIVAEGLPEDLGSRFDLVSNARWKLRSTEEYEELRRRDLPRHTSEVILTPEEVQRHPPILLDLTEDAVIIYDRGGFLARELELLRSKLREMGAKRVKTGKGWYWMLKPDAKPGEVIEA